MNHEVSASQSTPTCSAVNEAYLSACRFIAPLFDLRDMVAVNPFMGFLDQAFSQAALTIESLFHESIVPHATPDSAVEGPRVLCVADQLQSTCPEIVEAPFKAITRFLGARYDSSGPSPFRGPSLYSAYHEFAATDRSVDANGLVGYRTLFAKLPFEECAARELLVSKLDCDAEALTLYFGRLLARVKGFGGYLRALSYEGGTDTLGELPELLTILLAQDFALAQLRGQGFGPVRISPSTEYIHAFHQGLELLKSEETSLATKLAKTLRVPNPKSERALAQAVFCIDVRSERYRRLLEQQGNIETYGFAGFFGIAMEVAGANGHRPHCPPLLKPALSIAGESQGAVPGAGLKAGFQRSLAAPVSSLGHVEAWGMTYAWKLLKDAFPQRAQLAPSQKVETSLEHLPLNDRVGMAKGVLKNIGLKQPVAPFVVLVGHDSKVTNNLQEASLACGACAGHSGGPNAQVASALLNDPLVRRQLEGTDQEVPSDVVFLAAVHETVSDTVQFVERTDLSATQRDSIQLLKQSFLAASDASRQERVAVLDGGESTTAERGFIGRTHDYAETQAEWGLAGNAAFIVGQRELSEKLDLQGRAFLHSYDEAHDEDASILEMILTAPAVVGSWINLQYYASTVAPRTFGCGRKTLHNLCGASGVLEGGQGDLAVGLSRESLTQGTQDGSAHAPLRLHLMIQTTAERVCEIVARHPSLRNLVVGEWVRVSTIAVEERGVSLHALTPQRVLDLAGKAVAAQ